MLGTYSADFVISKARVFVCAVCVVFVCCLCAGAAAAAIAHALFSRFERWICLNHSCVEQEQLHREEAHRTLRAFKVGHQEQHRQTD